jgi:DNA-binding transcriptional MerR regulator
VWERHYAPVASGRTANGGRLYATQDISRLRLIKQRVDSSDNIGAVATLSLEALEVREAQTKVQTITRPTQTREPIRMVVIGDLSKSTAQPRHRINKALEKVIEAENALF